VQWQWDAAIADYTAALKIEPKMPTALYGRGLAQLKKGNAGVGNADMAAANAVNPKIADEFSRYGVK
jgi:hypothetical protein